MQLMIKQQAEPNRIKVFLISAKNPQDKILKLGIMAKKYFNKKEALVFLVEDEKAANFLDKLLWEIPKESFLPHACSDFLKENTFLYVSKNIISFERVHSFFNLRKSPLIPDREVCRIFEFEDTSTPEKKKICVEKFGTYQKLGFQIISV
jgi:DNA polymerase IIIc chi subunit